MPYEGTAGLLITCVVLISLPKEKCSYFRWGVKFIHTTNFLDSIRCRKRRDWVHQAFSFFELKLMSDDLNEIRLSAKMLVGFDPGSMLSLLMEPKAKGLAIRTAIKRNVSLECNWWKFSIQDGYVFDFDDYFKDRNK